MEKCKMLVNRANSTMFRDIFMNCPDDFVCLSTSNYWDDVKGHLRVYEPEVFTYVLEEDDDQWLSLFKNIKESLNFSKTPIVVVTTEELYKNFDTNILNYIDHVLLRPITVGNLFIEVKSFLNAKKLEEERARIAAEEEAARKAAGPVISSASATGKTVLVVDDDKNVLKLLKAVLEPTYSVVTMIAGKMAEKYLETRKCDLILLDYQMPGETGPEVFEKIKQIDLAKDIPIVFLTGVADREKIAEVLRLKPQGYLLKPIDAEKLFDTIERIIG